MKTYIVTETWEIQADSEYEATANYSTGVSGGIQGFENEVVSVELSDDSENI